VKEIERRIQVQQAFQKDACLDQNRTKGTRKDASKALGKRNKKKKMLIIVTMSALSSGISKSMQIPLYTSNVIL